jgi:hypothetical protein
MTIYIGQTPTIKRRSLLSKPLMAAKTESVYLLSIHSIKNVSSDKTKWFYSVNLLKKEIKPSYKIQHSLLICLMPITKLYTVFSQKVREMNSLSVQV